MEKIIIFLQRVKTELLLFFAPIRLFVDQKKYPQNTIPSSIKEQPDEPYQTKEREILDVNYVVKKGIFEITIEQTIKYLSEPISTLIELALYTKPVGLGIKFLIFAGEIEETKKKLTSEWEILRSISSPTIKLGQIGVILSELQNLIKTSIQEICKILGMRPICSELVELDTPFAQQLLLPDIQNFSINEKEEEKLLIEADKLYAQSKLTEARAAYLQLLKFLPKNAKIWEYLGEMSIRAGKPSRAEEEFKECLRLDPQNERAKKRINNIGAKNGEF